MSEQGGSSQLLGILRDIQPEDLEVDAVGRVTIARPEIGMRLKEVIGEAGDALASPAGQNNNKCSNNRCGRLE